MMMNRKLNCEENEDDLLIFLRGMLYGHSVTVEDEEEARRLIDALDLEGFE